LNGGAVISSDIASRMMNYFTVENKKEQLNPMLTDLTARELEILELIAEEKTNTKIASQLKVSSKTIANHISNILNKLHVVDRHEAKKLYKRSSDTFELEEDDEMKK
jgi:DNA-binding NarL/FixJ family response regulator